MNTTTAPKKLATRLRTLDGWQGDAALYELSPPMAAETWRGPVERRYVIVSAITAPSDTGRPETYIFGCDADGSNVDFSELDGSFRGGCDHARALNGAGYEVAA